VNITSNPTNLDKLTDDQLIAAIKEKLGITAQQIVELCFMICCAADRGIDVNEILPPPLRRWYKHVAAGQVLPELISRFMGMPSFLDRFARLPLPDQQRVVSDSISVAEPDGAVRLLPPAVWTQEQLRLVVADDHLRTPAEQRVLLKQQKKLSLSVPHLPGIQIDRRAKKVSITVPMELTKQELIELAAYLGGK
jgi:hypothetical protein